MIEGTDNFKIKILNSLPPSPPILDFRVKSFADSDFRSRLVTLYLRDKQSSGFKPVAGKDYIDNSHHNIVWQARALQLFQEKRVSYQASAFFLVAIIGLSSRLTVRSTGK